MKKASQIILIISGIFDLILVAGVVLYSVIAIITALVTKTTMNPEWFAELEQYITETGVEVEPETLMWIVVAVYCVIVLVVSLIAMVFFIVAGILALKGSKAKNNNILIANIVFAVLTQTWLTLVGAILGIIGLSIEAKRQAQPVAEAKEEPVEEPKQIEEK